VGPVGKLWENRDLSPPSPRYPNKGKLSKVKGGSSSELSDEEIGRIETASKAAAREFQPAEPGSN